jgi:hypothetical protein
MCNSKISKIYGLERVNDGVELVCQGGPESPARLIGGKLVFLPEVNLFFFYTT